MKKSTSEWSLKNVMNDCAITDLQQTVISPRYKESVFTFRHDDVINGMIQTFIMPEMEISRMDVQSAKTINAFQDDGLERYVSTFIYNGHIRTTFTDTNTTLSQTKQQHSFVHARAEDGEHIIAAGTTSIVYINIQPALLKTFMPCWEECTNSWYKTHAAQQLYVSPALPFGQNSRMQQVLWAIYDADAFTGATRSLYIEAKAMELLALQLEALMQLNTTDALPTLAIDKADKEKLVAMYEYITQHYLQPLSLRGLARQFTLNEFKLKKGFKALYHQSVFNYIHTLRMQHAKMLLQQGDMMVNEVSDVVGYSSIHNFSNAFYKMFNCRPSTVQKAG